MVTGGTGFVGNRVIEYLLARDVEVHVLSRHPGQSDRVAWHAVDLLDHVDRRAVIESVRPTHILNLAWTTEHGSYWTDPTNLDWCAATLDLVQQAAARGAVRVVGIGSCAEYDWGGEYDVLSEAETPRKPTTLYGICKCATGDILLAYSEATGLSAAWGMLFFLFGEFESPERLVPSVINSLLRGLRTPTTSGDQIRDFLSVDIAASALVELLFSDVRGRVNIASGEGIKVADLARRIAVILDREALIDIGSLANRPGDPARLVADARRLRQEVGFHSDTSLDTQLRQAISWWRERSRSDTDL